VPFISLSNICHVSLFGQYHAVLTRLMPASRIIDSLTVTKMYKSFLNTTIQFAHTQNSKHNADPALLDKIERKTIIACTISSSLLSN